MAAALRRARFTPLQLVGGDTRRSDHARAPGVDSDAVVESELGVAAATAGPHSRRPTRSKITTAILGGSMVFRWLLNSLIVSLGTTAGVLILCSLAGYGFARLEFPFRRSLFVLVLLGLAIPEQAVILPRHELFAQLHLHNSYPGLILPGLISSFGVFFMTQYFRAIPLELDEAAMLDGASRLKIFWKVLMPLTVPAQATLGVFTFLASWNDYWWPLISRHAQQHVHAHRRPRLERR